MFQKNIDIFKRAIGEERFNQLDWDYIKKRQEESDLNNDFNFWKDSQNKAILMPEILPRSQDLMNYYLDMSKQYVIGDAIGQYLNDHECDPHLFEAIKIAFDSLIDTNFDVSKNMTVDGFDVENLIVVDTGNGEFLKYMIDRYNPKNLIIAVSCWEDYVSSFHNIDWLELTQKYEREKGDNPHRIGLYMSRVRHANEILSMIAKNDITSLDHSLLCFPHNLSKKANTVLNNLNSKTAQNIVNYLGFTQDEYNMVMTSTKKLQSKCHIYTPPLKMHQLSNVIVCASGPSLDQSLPALRSLQENHFIIASASCYGTLRRNGVRVDALVVLERGYSDFDDYNTIIQECGRDSAMLITSSVSDIKLHSLFDTSITYFRVSLTPFALFAEHYNEHLPFDGPQAVNSAVSLAMSFNPKTLLLVGVDLGAIDLDKTRSDGAVGISPRSLKLKKKSNLNPEVDAYTDTYMSDACIILEEVYKIFAKNVNALNASNGIQIEGYESINLDEYILSIAKGIPNDHLKLSNQAIASWTKHCRVSTTEDFYALWHRGGQRLSIRKAMNSLRNILKSSKGHLTEYEYYQITQIFSVDKPSRDQFAARITRGCFLKFLCSLKRQHIVMANSPTQRDQFFDNVRERTIPFIDKFEAELYDLCSSVEKGFQDDGSQSVIANLPLA